MSVVQMLICSLRYRENKLGTGGDVAEEFAVLVKALWFGQYRSIAPKDFKVNIVSGGCCTQV